MSITDGICAQAKASDKPYKLSDQQNLYLLVSVAGTKSWIWGYKLFDPAKDKVCQYAVTLGVFPDMSVKKARSAREKAAEFVERGEHPPRLKAKVKANTATQSIAQENTVWGAVDSWLIFRTPEWSDDYAAQARKNLTKYAGPTTELGKSAYTAVTRPTFFTLFESIGQKSPTVARLVKQWLTASFERLVDAGKLPFSPLAGMRTKSAIPTVKTKNATDLRYPELKTLLINIRHYRERRMAIYLELLARTCVRSTELRCAIWSEVDLKNATWVIPAERMKMRKQHVVPLSTQVVRLLEELQDFDGGVGPLFPHSYKPGETMVISSPKEALYRLTTAFSPHGFRTTFSTAAHEAGKPPHLIEAVLAHQERNKTALAYNKSTFIAERRTLMQWWSDELDGLINSKDEQVSVPEQQAA